MATRVRVTGRAWRAVACGLLIAAAPACTAQDAGPQSNAVDARGLAAMTFDPAIWRDQVAIYSDAFPRRRMVADLRRNHLSTGMTREQVTALIGPPTDTAKFRDHGLVYWVGPEPGGVSIDSQWLLIDLDPSGRVVAIDVATD